MKNLALLLVAICAFQYSANAFCGFFVAKADAKLFNKASEVILVRDGEHTTVTMKNDFKGDVNQFAMVVPVPTVLKETDIKTVDEKVFTTLDGYSGPRLVEYHDRNPCEPVLDYAYAWGSTGSANNVTLLNGAYNVTLTDGNVQIEAEYKIDEYDILILSAKESTGLQTWLNDNGYKVPSKAAEVLAPYIKNNLKFFVVKVDAERLKAKGGKMSPIQIKYNSPKFMLPIRLGMANAEDFQDMIVYGLTRKGRIECTNYRTVEIPTARNVPTFIREDFGPFYKDLFDREYAHQGKNAVFLEYAWNVTPSWGGMKCDPCTGPPPINQDLVNAGINWDMNAEQVFFTRLHVRYTKDKFPQDLLFQVTPNKENFQGRYIITNPASGDFNCEEGQNYLSEMVNRRQRELDELQALAGWDPIDKPLYVDGYRKLIKNESDRNDIVTPLFPGSNFDSWLPKLIFSIVLVLLIVFFLVRSNEMLKSGAAQILLRKRKNSIT
ncbi:MAG: hypothetical protein ACI9J3_003946 [Parvicellaceae bacterium]|jgi:hypothetical protein